MLLKVVLVLCGLVALVMAQRRTEYGGNTHGSDQDLCYVPLHSRIAGLSELPPSYGYSRGLAFVRRGAHVIVECQHTDFLTRKKTSVLKAFKCDGHNQIYANCYNNGVKLTERNLLVLYKDVQTPHEAERQCLLKGGHLASITGQAENQMAVSLMAYANIPTALIGLTDRGFEGYYQWMDGTRSRWTNWYKGYPRYSVPQPNDHGLGEDYVVIQRTGANGQWFDVGPPRLDSNVRTGDSSFSYLCKFKKIDFTKDGNVNPYENGHCPGGSVKNDCANQCTERTCKYPIKNCYYRRRFPCISGCVCPDNLPIYDNENKRCITAAQCLAPKTSEPECHNGKEWSDCPSVCTATCKDRRPACTKNCGTPACACPARTPLLHKGECIAEKDCPREPQCSGGQEHSPCANACSQQTCTDRFQSCARFTALCEPGCRCPRSKPYLHQGQCLTKVECDGAVTPTCSGGKAWDPCGNICDQKTCSNTFDSCIADLGCEGECKCPESRPILHHGRCIAESLCPGRNCESNLVYQRCGSDCTATCDDPNPICTSQCVPRCGCPSDLPILHNGRCIAERFCPVKCESNLVYQRCASGCTATCDNPNPICTSQCVPRCACPSSLPILHNGRCIAERFCPVKCESNLVYQRCASGCTATCDNRGISCSSECVPRCACPSDMPILHNGICIAESLCPVKCENNLVYQPCASDCTATCDDPNPRCTSQCVSKCACPSDMPILDNGICIDERFCPSGPSVDRQCVGVASYRDECDRLCKCSGSTLDYCCRERKAFHSLTNSEKDRLLRAMSLIATDSTYRPEWLQLTRIHVNNFISPIHQGSQFFPWHREYLYLYEDLLRKVDCKITLPFWDWTKEREGTIYQSEIFSTSRGFGGNGVGARQCINADYFSNYRLSNNGCIKRDFNTGGNCAHDRWPTLSQMRKAVTEVSSRRMYETAIRGTWHNTIHNCFGDGSTLRGRSSAEEPLFALHHTMVDYAWWSWQEFHSDHSWPSDWTRLIGFSNKRISSVLVSEKMRDNDGVCYAPESTRDLSKELAFENFAPNGGSARGVVGTAGFDTGEGCGMAPEDTLADKLTEQELEDIAAMNKLLGITSDC